MDAPLDPPQPNPARQLAQQLQLAAGRRGGAPPSPRPPATETTAGHDGDAPDTEGASEAFYAASEAFLAGELAAIFADADAADAREEAAEAAAAAAAAAEEATAGAGAGPAGQEEAAAGAGADRAALPKTSDHKPTAGAESVHEAVGEPAASASIDRAALPKPLYVNPPADAEDDEADLGWHGWGQPTQMSARSWADAQDPPEPKAAFDRRMQNKRPLEEPGPAAAAEAGSPGPATPAGAGSPGLVGGVDWDALARAIPAAARLPPLLQPPPATQQASEAPQMPAPMPPPPSMPGSSSDMPGGSSDAVPVKPMPKRPVTKHPAGFYRDVRIAAAEEEEARDRAVRFAAAQAPAGVKPVRHPDHFSSDEASAFALGQQSMAGRVASAWNPYAHQAVLGKGKGKARVADPFIGMTSSAQQAAFGKGKGKKGKGHGPRDPIPCSRCGAFYVCASVAAAKNQEAHCTNPQCERSLEFAAFSPEQQRLLITANLEAKKAAAAAAALSAHEARMAAEAAMAAAPPRPVPAATRKEPVVTVIDDTQFSPLTPADAAMPAAAHSDTDVSGSPLRRPADTAPTAGTCSKARASAVPGPPTTHSPPKAPSPADWAFGDALPGQPAAGAAVETVDLLTQEAHAAEVPPPPPQYYWPDGRPFLPGDDPAAFAAATWPGGPPAVAGPPPPPARSPDGRTPEPEDDLPAQIAATWPDAQGTQEDMLRWAARELQTLRADAQRTSEELRAARQRAEDSEQERLRLERQVREQEERDHYLAARMDQLDGALMGAQDFIKDACYTVCMARDTIRNAREVFDAMRQI